MKLLYLCSSVFICGLSCEAGTPTVSISTNKTFIIGTNNMLAPTMTNFFSTNIYPLTNALALAGFGGGGSSANFAPNIVTNAAGKIDLATTIQPTNIAALNTISGMGLSISNANTSIVNPAGNTVTLTLQGQTSGGTTQTIQSNPGGLNVGPVFLENGGTVLGITDILAGGGLAVNNWSDDGRGSLSLSNLAASGSITAATNITAGGAFYGLNGGLTNANGNPLVDQTITNTLSARLVLAGTTESNSFQPLNAHLTSVAGLANAAGVLTNNGSGSISWVAVGGGGGSSGTFSAGITNTGAQGITNAGPLTNGGVVYLATNLFQPKTNFANFFFASNSVIVTNITSGSQSFVFGDNYGDGLTMNDATGALTLTNSGSVTAGNPNGITLDGEGNFFFNGNGNIIVTNLTGFDYAQNVGSDFVLFGNTTNNLSYQEILDLMPISFNMFYGNDELVCSANSNNANIRLTADASITYGALRHNITNVSGLTSYTATMFDRIIEDNPTVAGNTTITLPSEATHGLVLPTAAEPFRAWTSQNGYVGGGHPIMAAWQTTEYWVYNLGSNTANTLTVVLPFAATNTGLTSIVVPNQMAAHFTCTGTNGGIATAMELQPMTFSPAYNGVNITNLSASAISSGIYGNRIGFGGQDAATLPGTETTKFQPLFGIAATPQATETNSSQFLPGVALLTNLWVSVQPALGAGSNVVYIVRTNGVATGITVTITSGSTGSLGSDTAHFAWITNAVVDMNVQTTMTGTAESVNWTLQY